MTISCPLCNSKFEYNAYLQTEHWKNKRLLKLSRADNKCQVCNSPDNLQVHHRVYGNLFEENDNDLVVLCGSCHQLFHKNNTLGSPKKTIPDINNLLPKNNAEIQKVSFLRGYNGPEGTFVIPWFDKLPIGKIDIDKFWADFLLQLSTCNEGMARILTMDVYTFLGFDTNQDSAFIEHGEDNSFSCSYFDETDTQKELSEYFREFCNKKIFFVSKNSNVLQVIK